MAPAERWPGGAGLLAQQWTGCRRQPEGRAWGRCSALLLLVALISALQHPVRGSSTVQPDASISVGDSWPEELSSSAASEILALYGQEETENTTLFYNATSTSRKLDDPSPNVSIQDTLTVQFEGLGPSESPITSPIQPSNSGLNDTSILPLLTLTPYNQDGFISSSLPSPSSSLPSSSSPPPYQTFSAVASTSVPYFDEVTEGEVLTQHTTRDVVNSSSRVTIHFTSSWEIAENSTTELVKENQSVKSTQSPWHTDSLEPTKNVAVPSSLSSETSAIQTIYTLPYESTVTSTTTESYLDSFSSSYKPSTPFNTTFTILLDTVGASSLESGQVETRTTTESGSHFNTSTYVPVTQEESASRSTLLTEQPSTGFIEPNSYYFTGTSTIPSSEETSVEATSSELSSSPNTMMSTMSVTTSAPLNPSTAFISVRPSDYTHAEHTIGSSLSDGLSTMIYNTDVTVSKFTNHSTSTLQGQNVTEIDTSFSPTQSNLNSEEMTSQLTKSVGASTNRPSTITEERHTQSINDDMTSWSSIATSETPSEVSLSSEPSTVTYGTSTMTETLKTVHTVDTSQVFMDHPSENTIFPSTSITLSTSDHAVHMESSTREVASSVKTTTLPISLDKTSEMSLGTSNEIVNITSPLETITSVTSYSHSVATLTSERPPEISSIIDTSANIRQTYSTGETTHIAISSQEDSSFTLTVAEPLTSTALKSTSNLGVSEMAAQTVTDNSSAMYDITSPPEGNTSVVIVPALSVVTTGSETLTFSWVSSAMQETSTSTDSMDINSTPYSSYTTTGIPDGTTPSRPTELETSTTYRSSSFPTSNFDELSTDFKTSSGQSTSNIAVVSEVTSPLESTAGSTAMTPSHAVTLWTITDNTNEASTNTFPVTLSISAALSSSQSTNIDTKTESLPKSTTWDISSPQPLSNGVTTPLLSTLTQPSVSAMDNKSSTTEITTASDNTRSHGTIMLSSGPHLLSSGVTTPSLSTVSQPSVSAMDNIGSTTEITTASDSTRSHGTIMLSSGPQPLSSGVTTTSLSTLSQPSVSAMDNIGSTTEITTASDSTRSHGTIMLSSGPQPLSSGVTTTSLSTLSQPSVSAMDNMGSTTEITTASDNTRSQDTIMLSSGPQPLSSGVTTPLLSTLSQPSVSAMDNMGSTTEITTVSDNTRSHGTIMLSSGPQPLSSGVTTPLLSTLSQPSVSAMDNMGSTTEITTASDNTRSHGTIMLSRGPHPLSSGVTTPLLSTLSQPSVSAMDNMGSTTEITTVSDNTRSHGTIMLSSGPQPLSSGVTTPLLSTLSRPSVSAMDNMGSTTEITTASDNTRSHGTIMLSSGPQPLSSGVTTPLLSTLSQPSVSAMDNMSSITEITTASNNTRSQGTLMLSSGPHPLSSGVTTPFLSTLSQPSVSAVDNMSSTTEITTASDNTISQGTIMLSSGPQPLSSGVTTPFLSTLSQPSVSAMDNMSSITEITTASDNTRSQGTIMVSSGQSTDSSVPSTVQPSSRNSENQTRSDGLQSTTTNSPSTVTSLVSQRTTQTESLAATTVDIVNSDKSSTHRVDTTMAILHTTSYVSSATIKSIHPSSFSPLTTTSFPTNISDSLSTVSSVVSSAELSTVPTTGNATQNFTPPEKPSPSSVTLTTPTTHVSPSIIYTLLSTHFTKSTPTPTLGVITTGSTHVTPTNHTIHTPTTVVLPTKLQTTTLTSPPSTTTHTPRTDTVTTVSDTTKVSTVFPHSITSSTMASTATSLRTPVASVTPAASTTVLKHTTLATMPSTSTTPSTFECKLSTKTMVKTVLTLSNQSQTAAAIVQKFEEFLNLTLYRALNQSIQIFVNRTSLSLASLPGNATVGYSIAVNASVYIPSAIVEVLTGKDVFSITELKVLIPALQSVPIIAETWEPQPDIRYRVQTVLKLMGTGANVHTCVYVQNMEERLQAAYETAELASTGERRRNLSVQILSTSQDIQILTLIYVVKHNNIPLNGMAASSLLNFLSGEVVGYYLGDPPFIIAEPLYYPNIDTSSATMNYWVYTVIQGVDSQLLGPENQSFAQQMEKRLATLFQISSQQSRRFRRATIVGSYTVQMVKMQRLDGPNNLAELTYYALKDGQPILGTVAAKQLSTIDPQIMALTLEYIVRVQANPVVQKPPNNLWIIAAVLAPIAVVTVIIIIITAVLCRKNKSDFKSDNISNLPPRTKPVQGFDYAKQHLGQQGGDEEMLPVTQETVVPSLNLSQERDSTKDGSTEKMLKSSDNRKSRSPCENGSVISNESEEASSGRSTPQKVMAQHRGTKDEACKRNVPISDEEEGNIHYDKNKMLSDPFDSSSGSVQLIAIKPVSIPPALTLSERNQEMSIINGEVNKALKQKSDIEHYRNKLRLKAKRKGYYDFPPIESKSLNDRKRKVYENTQMEIDNVLDDGTNTSSPFADPKNRQTSMKNHPYRSRQSLNSPSPGETEMDLLVTRERPRRGIRNSGYDTEPEVIEETNIDRVKQARTFIKPRQAKGHSETSTLSSQPSIDEVRQQMHMLLEEAFSLASAGHGGAKRQADPYASVQHMPYSEVVTSAPGTMSRPRMQWVPTYGPEVYQYSLPRPNYRFSQLPEMVVGSPPPPVPPRTGPVAVPSLRRSTSDMANKNRVSEPGENDQGPGEHVGFPAVSRVPVPVAQTNQSLSNYSGNSMPAVFAIPGSRAGYSGYYIPQPPASYRNQAWMSYSGENDLPGQWADSVPLPGYIEAYPRSRYPQNSPSRLPRQFGQPGNLHPSLDHATGPSIGASQQSLADTDTPDASITNLSTAALVKAIREEVAKLAKKQTDMFEFQV